ncbi:stage III sporulation protein AG [Marinicrinis lubricantis]|uniref:Stage III sporulation protein AG n=1 Tax=Marinicrinis lubricantis TaxID=2086470 RepID=A0ABW1IRX6_9BACL
MGKWLQFLERWIGGGKDGEKKVKTLRMLILLGLVGVAFVVLNSFITDQSMNLNDDRASPPEEGLEQPLSLEEGASDSLFLEYERDVENRVKEVLSKIVGVGAVDVMVSIESTEEKVVYRNTRESQQLTNEKDVDGATRHITSITKDGEIVLYEVSGGQQPIILKTIKPKIRGIIIVAGGAENATVKQLIVESVRKGLGVPSHRLSVVPRKQS